jgi:hypothetical protein
MAGLDGVLNKIEPGEPMDKNMYELPPEELAKVPQVPGSLAEALDCLEKDHAFLLKGDVFTKDFLEMWISHKRKEADALRLRPHPYEFHLYYDVTSPSAKSKRHWPIRRRLFCWMRMARSHGRRAIFPARLTSSPPRTICRAFCQRIKTS